MKKKYIQTKATLKWQRLNTFGWFIPLIIFVLQCVFTLPKWMINEGLEKSDLPYGITILSFTSLFLSFPIWLLWRSLCNQIWKNNVQRSTFKSIDDLEYFRDKLTGLSPIEISMLTDLNIEMEKDVSAKLLQYQMDGIINIDGNFVQIINPDAPSLSANDKTLLEVLAAHPLTPNIFTHLKAWKTNEYNHTVSGPYFQKKQPLSETVKAGNCLGCFGYVVLPILALGIIFTFIYNSDIMKHTFDLIDSIPEGTSEPDFVRHMVATDYKFLLGIIGMIVEMLLGIFVLVWPLATVIRSVTKASGTTKIQRTALGEQMTEYVYGMKNFIHDFSNLSEATKEQLVLWDDFLIYAVVLEENEQILQEIFGRKSIDYHIIQHL